MIMKIGVQQNCTEEILASWDTKNRKVQEDLSVFRVVFSSQVSHGGQIKLEKPGSIGVGD